MLTSLGVQTQRLVDLSNALLDLEEATSTGFDRSIVAADVLIESAIADLRELAIAAGRSIEVLASSAEVRIDQRWVGLAVGNLVANAIKHGSGTIKVAVEVGQGDSPPMLRIDVTDEGGGIPTDLGVKAFDRFARADTSRSTPPGNGLGLALVAAIARRNGGTAALVPGGIEIEIPCD